MLMFYTLCENPDCVAQLAIGQAGYLLTHCRTFDLQEISCELKM